MFPIYTHITVEYVYNSIIQDVTHDKQTTKDSKFLKFKRGWIVLIAVRTAALKHWKCNSN